MSSKIKPFIIQGLIAIIILAVGIFCYKMFLSDKVVAKRGQRPDTGILVEVVPVTKKEHTVVITGTGQAEASRTQNLKSEANGRVIWISDRFYPGARLKKGEVIAKINTEDYAIKLANAKIQLRQKEVSLMLEEARGRAASSELDTLKKTMTDTTLSDDEAALVKRQPQLQSAIADVELAKNNLKQAQLDYNRSIVKCPYDAIVQTTNISIGDYISGGTQLGSIVASDEFWVYLSLNPANVAWFNLSSQLSEIKAEVRYDIGGKTITKPAQIRSVQPAVESLGRMVQVLLAVQDPMSEPVNEALFIGAFVHASIYAPDPLDSIELPRAYVREGNLAYVCTSDNKLSIRNLTTPYRTDDNVYVTDGLQDGDRVVTTMISSPVEGRKLRVKGETDVVGTVSEDTGRGFGPPR